MFDSEVCGSKVELANNGIELFVACAPPCYQRGPAPRSTNSKIQRSTQIARVQRAFGERPCFADSVSAHRNSVEKRTCRHVQKLAKQVLVHVERIFRIAAEGLLDPCAEGEHIVAEMKRGIEAEVESVICGIAIDDGIRARQRYLSAGITHLKKATGPRQIAEMKMVSTRPLRLNGGTRKGEQVLASRYRIDDIQFRVQRIDSRVFEDWLHGKIREKAYPAINSQSFVTCGLKQFAFRSFIFTGSIRSLGECGECLCALMLLAKNVRLRQQILVIRVAFR